MDNYETYLNHPAGDILRIEEAMQIYDDILKSVEKCKIDDKWDFVNEFLKKACIYATTRQQWEFMPREERINKDSSRTITHNVFIDSINILARLLNSDGVETPWREQLGNQRKRLGDFACYVAYIIGLNNR